MKRPIFPMLWACASLFHMTALVPSAWSGTKVLVGGAAIASLWSPGALPFLALAQLADWAREMPTPSNHWMVTAAVNTTIIAACVSTRSLRYSVIYPRFAPYARWCVVVLYAFAVFHKLNRDFFDPAYSCGASFVAAQTGLASATAGWFGIAVTFGAEVAILLCLVSRKKRAWGLLIGALFHAGVAFNPLSGFYNFSAMLLALFALFIPDEDWQNALTVLQQWRRTLIAGTVVFAGAFAIAPQVLLAWAAYAVLVIAVGIIAYLRRRHVVALRAPWSFAATIPLFLCLNSASPYLGLKTEATLAMYSNLRTEGGVTNHLLVPASVQLFSFQRQVTVLPDGNAVPSFEVWRHATASAGITDGLLRKTLAFREFDQGRQRCRH